MISHHIEIFRSLKNEPIVQVLHQLIEYHVVHFVVVVDFHVVEGLICLILFQLTEVEWVDLCFGIKFLHFRSENSLFFCLIVAVVVQVISLHHIKNVTNIRNKIWTTIYLYFVRWGKSNVISSFFVSVNCSCFFCTLFLDHCCGKLRKKIERDDEKIARKKNSSFFFDNMFIHKRLIDFFSFKKKNYRIWCTILATSRSSAFPPFHYKKKKKKKFKNKKKKKKKKNIKKMKK